MIKVEFNEIVQDKVDRSTHLTAGLSLIKSWTDSLVMPDNVVPIIAGGAVRDVFFKDTVPHDVDIFFVSGTDAQLPPREVLSNVLLQNLLLWFEDQEIDWRSLTRQQREEYDNAGNQNSYVEIFEFESEGITYQLMIPSSVPTLDGLLDRFPVMCKVAINHEGLYFTLPGFAAMTADRPVGYNQRDYSYLRKKHENEEVYLFNDVNHLFNALVHKLWTDLGYPTRTYQITSGISYASIHSGLRADTPAIMCRGLIRERFNIPRTNLLNNMAPALFSQYSSTRNRLAETPNRTATGTFATRSVSDLAVSLSALASGNRVSFS